jgi:hypothetical protein
MLGTSTECNKEAALIQCMGWGVLAFLTAYELRGRLE